MKLETRTCRQPLELITRDDSTNQVGILSGYIAMFNSDSVEMDGYYEQIRSGAFHDSLQKNDVVALVNHDTSAIVGRQSAGTLRLLEDSKGLKFEIDLPDTTLARDLKTNVKLGNLLGCSFGFQIDSYEWSKRGTTDVCTLTKIDLYECSVGVTFPAYPDSNMQMRDIYRARQKDHRKIGVEKLSVFKMNRDR